MKSRLWTGDFTLMLAIAFCAFVSCQALQAKQAGNGKFHFFHRFSHFLVNSAIYGMILLFFKYRSSSEKTQPQYF